MIQKTFFRVFLCFIAALGVGSFWLSRQYVVPIMTYHHVEKTDRVEPNWVSPANFERHMEYLHHHGFHVMRFSELVEAIEQGKKPSRKSVVITFDDGNEDNYTQAFPILKKYNFPAIMFVSSDLVNKPGRVTWDQLREMMAYGIEIGSHTRHHVYLPDKPLGIQIDEIKGSQRVLWQELGAEIKYFAYPSGGFSTRVKAILRESGYLAACTTNRGRDRLNRDLYELNRVRFSDKDNREDIFWAKFSGYYNFFRERRKPH